MTPPTVLLGIEAIKIIAWKMTPMGITVEWRANDTKWQQLENISQATRTHSGGTVVTDRGLPRRCIVRARAMRALVLIGFECTQQHGDGEEKSLDVAIGRMEVVMGQLEGKN